MQLSRTRLLRSLIAVALVAGCQGRLSILAEPLEEAAAGNDPGSVPGSGSDDPTGAPTLPPPLSAAGSCQRYVTDPLFDRTARRPTECGVCSCSSEGELACADRECFPQRTIVPCPPDIENGSVEFGVPTLASRADGTTLHLEASGTGCGDADDYLVCYRDDPQDPWVSVWNLAPEKCPGSYTFQTFDVDLSPLAQYAKPDSSILFLGFPGYAQFGEPTCNDRVALASMELQYQAPLVDQQCETDADCVGEWMKLSCEWGSCGGYAASQLGMVELTARRDAISEAICGPFFDAGCSVPNEPDPACDEPYPVACIDGTCGGVL